jgi:glycerol-3-phosphate O-acyltransferase
MMPIEQQTRGQRAQELLDNETLQQALDAIEAEVIQLWGDCPARDTDGKEALWQLYRTSKKFRGLLTGYVQTGKLATENMKHHEAKRGLRAVFGR